MRTGRQMLAEVEIRGPEAVLLLGAYALAVPMALCLAVHSRWDYRVATSYRPSLLLVAAALLKTDARVAHGFTTIAASSGTWFFIWALANGAAGAPSSSTFTLATLLAVLIAGAAVLPLLVRIPASPRIQRDAESIAAG